MSVLTMEITTTMTILKGIYFFVLNAARGGRPASILGMIYLIVSVFTKTNTKPAKSGDEGWVALVINATKDMAK